MNKKFVYGAIALTFIVAVIALLVGYSKPVRKVVNNVGAAITTNLASLGVANFAVGSGCDQSYTTCTGTNINRLNSGICYIDPYAATITGTTTALVDCQGTLAADASGSSALTGVTNGDFVQVLLSSTTATTASGNTPGLVITGASASTTAGHIVLRIANISGATYTWSTTAGTASGTAQYLITN